jgi:hypothetical protein
MKHFSLLRVLGQSDENESTRDCNRGCREILTVIIHFSTKNAGYVGFKMHELMKIRISELIKKVINRKYRSKAQHLRQEISTKLK